MAVLQSLKTLYRALPPWVTMPVRVVPDNVLFGRSYRESKPSVGDVVMRKNILRALEYARKYTVWGRENIAFDLIDADPERILRMLPVTDSGTVASHPEYFISDEASDLNSYWTTTGGTGRSPTSIRLSNSSYGVEWKHMHHIWRSCKFRVESSEFTYLRRRDLKLTFRGYHLNAGELVRFDPIYNELSVDPFQLNDGNFKKFLGEVRRYKISCIHGYPSLVTLFMERLRAIGEHFPVRLLFLGSEGISAEKKRELAEFFEAKVISWYGQSEKVVLAYDADMSGRFVNFSSYGYPWILNPDENGVGEIVGTTFINKAMPLVNYRTGDYGRIVREDGKLIIEELQGRWGKDFVYRAKGEMIPTSAINLHEGIQKKIIFYQLVQKEYGKIDVKVLPKSGFEAIGIAKELKRELNARLKGFDINCTAVKSDAEIVRSSRGKMIMLVQDIKE